MSDVSEEEWRSDLTFILESLDDQQYKKTLEFLDEIPRSRKCDTSREQMPATIIQHYGLPGSISAINDVMVKIPRNDPRLQNKLKPHVEKLRQEQEKDKQGKKRKRDEDGVLTDVTQNQFDIQNQQKSCQPTNETNATWRKSIRDLESSTILETDGFVGKVVQKSGLRPYQTKDKARKCFFYLAVADETAGVKVKVYGKDRYDEIEVGSSYLFSRSLIKEEKVIMVTKLSKVSQTRHVDVPEELEMEATRLIYPESPVYSIKDAKLSADKTKVSVEGTVTEIDPVEKTKVNNKRQKVKTQRFHLKDETGSIWINMWDEGAVGECRGLSVGDVVKLANMKTHKYYEDVSLNSTASTRIIKVQSVGVQNERIEILGIKKATKKETQLDAEIDHQLHTFVVATRLLAKTVGFKLTGDFKGSLLDKLPFSADAEIRGNEIIKITAASKV
ncbi:uncharacterized protein [Cebidichthys violaceus]|uniref:uncharacterized protein n=1 Tax=Cebidichthys violaceus TaxID=271503 RepID=UPI0035CA7265